MVWCTSLTSSPRPRTAGARCAGGDGVPHHHHARANRPAHRAPLRLDYGYESRELVPTDPLPHDLAWLRERAAALVDLDPGEFAQILVSRYPPGATIGWHRDAPIFGPTVVGVSLASACRMRFQRGKGDARQVAEVAWNRARPICCRVPPGTPGSTPSHPARPCATPSPSGRLRCRSGRQGGVRPTVVMASKPPAMALEGLDLEALWQQPLHHGRLIGPVQERQPAPGLVHDRPADRPGRGGLVSWSSRCW
jgi:2-oxoglutarate-Fe(II)-dependent oxygenase superfamily protein